MSQHSESPFTLTPTMVNQFYQTPPPPPNPERKSASRQNGRQWERETQALRWAGSPAQGRILAPWNRYQSPTSSFPHKISGQTVLCQVAKGLGKPHLFFVFYISLICCHVKEENEVFLRVIYICLLESVARQWSIMCRILRTYDLVLNAYGTEALYYKCSCPHFDSITSKELLDSEVVSYVSLNISW